MFCNCSNAHNYEVRGLCPVGSLILSPTATEPWVEVSIPEILKIEACKPPVENIDKVFINAKVISTKVIDTPYPTVPNTENLSLTGKKLVVDLELCQTIIYTADVPEQSVHALQTTMPYCTYIVLPPTADVDTSKYCVDVCIEDVFARVIDCRTVFKNSTVFMRARELQYPECNL